MMQVEKERRFARFPEVHRKVGLSRTTLWRLERAQKFPRRRQLSPGTVGWDVAEIEQWLESRQIVGERDEVT